MKVLIACEESQRVCIAFRERGHEAYSGGIICANAKKSLTHKTSGKGNKKDFVK